MNARPETTRYSLARRELVGLADERGFVIECESGELWITADQLAGDHILHAGERLSLRGRPRAVISALAPSRFTATACCGSSPVTRIATRCVAALADRIRRWQHVPLAAYPITHVR